MSKKKLKELPEFKTEEEAKFWATHDSTEYLNWDEAEMVEGAPLVRSLRCPVCDEVLLSRYVDVEVAGGRATLHGLRELYCQEGHITRLAPEAEEIVHRVEETLREEELVSEVT